MTESRVETTRGSKTTVQRPERALVAPSIRVARSTASPAARRGRASPGPRPTLNPVPVWLSAPSPAMARPRGTRSCGGPWTRDAGRRGEGHLDPAVAVVGRGDLAHPGIGRRVPGARARAPGRPLLHGRGGHAVVPQVESTAATPSGSASTTSGSGVAKRRCRGPRPAWRPSRRGRGTRPRRSRPGCPPPSVRRGGPGCPTPDEAAEDSDSTSPS